MKKQFSIVTLSICLSAIVMVGSAKAQTTDGQDAVKLKATLVNVPVIVSDRDGRYISGLRAADFTLYSDHVKQNVAVFEATEEPLNVALLLDTSLSTHRVLDDIKEAAISFIKRLRPKDRALIVSFDYDVHVLSKLTSDHKALEQAIKSAYIGDYAGTVLHDAVVKTTDELLRSVQGRKAIVLLTDGKDHGSAVSEDTSLESAQESGAMIYSISYQTGFGQKFGGRRGGNGGGGGWRRSGLDFPRRRPNMERRRERAERNNEAATEYLSQLSDVSAGRFYKSEVTDLKKTFDQIADELRYQYRLGFYGSSDPSDTAVHRLTVQVARADAVVRARHTYHAGTAE
jgi:VWFA-related protein